MTGNSIGQVWIGVWRRPVPVQDVMPGAFRLEGGPGYAQGRPGVQGGSLASRSRPGTGANKRRRGRRLGWQRQPVPGLAPFLPPCLLTFWLVRS